MWIRSMKNEVATSEVLLTWSGAQRFLTSSIRFSWLDGSIRITGVIDLAHSDGQSPVKCLEPTSPCLRLPNRIARCW